MRKNGWILTTSSVIVLAFAGVGLIGRADQDFRGAGEWRVAGHDLSNTRNQPAEHLINSSNVSTLKLAWTFTTGGSVSATPIVAGNAVYFPDWAGNLYAVDKDTGQLIWSHKISDYDGFSTAISRVSPAVHGNELILGDNENPTALHGGANMMAVDRQTGALVWITKVEGHGAAIISGAPVVFGDTVYVGVSSNEESNLARNASYPCCAFRGSVVALDANTGNILWKTYDMPDNGGATNQYSGGAIWQPPAIDPRRGVLYIGTGNNYTVPASVEACQKEAEANNISVACEASDDYIDSALALDLQTGRVKWTHRADAGDVEWFYKVEQYDAWTTGCTTVPPNKNCPSPKGPDYDLGGSGPNLLDHQVGFGQKSGVYWAFNPDDGSVRWSTFVGPAGTGTLGGIEWGTATDGKRIYAEVADSGHVNYTLIPSGTQINWGSWSALDAETGNILWQTADPTSGSEDFGAVSVANGVVYAGSQSAKGYMYALDAGTGKILWSFASGGSVLDGPAIAGGFVYWGSGYRIGTNNNKLYAFTLP
ncbi:MAG: PQQ-binding-like beta-propeller repeat protein [Bryobacteraceae bacterium]